MTVGESTAERYQLADPDVRLMLEVRDGSAVAFEELVVRYQDRLTTVLAHLVSDRDLAEDLAQDVFLRVYRARESYEPGARFSTWIFHIAHNLALNAIRNRARRSEVKVDSPPGVSSGIRPLEAMAQAASGQMPVRVADKAETREMVQEAINSLGERQRMAVLLNKFEGMGYAEIAEAMELTPQAVKSLLCRARLRLRELLEPYLESGQRVPKNHES